MTTYQIAQGQNNTAGLATLDPQPRAVTPVVWDEAVTVSGEVVARGFGAMDFQYAAFETYSDLTTFLNTYFGFTFTSTPDQQSVYITARLRGWDGTTYANYNGLARVLPLQRPSLGYWGDVTIRLYQLSVI